MFIILNNVTVYMHAASRVSWVMRISRWEMCVELRVQLPLLHIYSLNTPSRPKLYQGTGTSLSSTCCFKRCSIETCLTVKLDFGNKVNWIEQISHLLMTFSRRLPSIQPIIVPHFASMDLSTGSEMAAWFSQHKTKLWKRPKKPIFEASINNIGHQLYIQLKYNCPNIPCRSINISTATKARP